MVGESSVPPSASIHPAVHVVELRGREPNCRISHVYFGTGNPANTDVYSEDPALTQIRLGCRSIVSPLLRRCNFNVETGSKQISIVGVSPQETAIDCGLSYDSECPHSGCLDHYNLNGLPAGAIPRRGIHMGSGSLLSNVSVGHCMANTAKPTQTFYHGPDKTSGCGSWSFSIG